MLFSDRVLGLTQDLILPKVADNVLGSNVLTLRLAATGKEGKGESIKKSVKYQSSGSGASFAGLDAFTASPLNTKVTMRYDMRAIRQPVAVPGMEAVANGVAETQVTDLVTEAMEETEMELADLAGTQFYGTGLGNSQKDLIGIGAIIDDGTDVTTLATLSRTTYPVLKATRTASGGTLNLSSLATLYTNISSGTTKSVPTLMVSDEPTWDLFEQLLTPMVRESYTQMGYYNMSATGVSQPTNGSQNGLTGTQGFVALTYKGIPWARDEKATAQNVFMLNENWLDWYGWDAKGVFGYNAINLGTKTVEGLYVESPMSQFTGLNWSGFRAPTNQFGGIADIIMMGNLMSFQPRRHGRLTGVLTV